jgi:hypothetical protein
MNTIVAMMIAEHYNKNMKNIILKKKEKYDYTNTYNHIYNDFIKYCKK